MRRDFCKGEMRRLKRSERALARLSIMQHARLRAAAETFTRETPQVVSHGRRSESRATLVRISHAKYYPTVDVDNVHLRRTQIGMIDEGQRKSPQTTVVIHWKRLSPTAVSMSRSVDRRVICPQVRNAVSCGGRLTPIPIGCAPGLALEASFCFPSPCLRDI